MLVAVGLLPALVAPVARAEIDGDVFTSALHGVRAEVPRGWRVSESSGSGNRGK